MRILHYDRVNHDQPSEKNRRFLVIERLYGVCLDIHQVVREMLADIVESEIALASDDGGWMSYQFLEDGYDVADEVVGEEVAEQGEGGHDDEGVLILQVLDDSVVHQQAEFVSRLD